MLTSHKNAQYFSGHYYLYVLVVQATDFMHRHNFIFLPKQKVVCYWLHNLFFSKRESEQLQFDFKILTHPKLID